MEVPAAVIDTGATLVDVEPGQGVGVFVEYAAGGRWRIDVSCDTLESEVSCAWDVIVSSREPMRNVHAENLSQGGSFEVERHPPAGHGEYALRFVTQATTALEGLRFETSPGATVRVDVMLDGVADGRYIYWVGGGAVHSGAPSSVLDLLPTAP